LGNPRDCRLDLDTETIEHELYASEEYQGLQVVILPKQFGVGLPPPILFTNNEAVLQELAQ